MSKVLDAAGSAHPWRSAAALVAAGLVVLGLLWLVLSRFFWTSAIWYLPYAAFWIWMIIICIRLIRRPAAVLSGSDRHARKDAEKS